MAILRIPLSVGVPAFTQRVMLEQREYVIDLHWNDRAGSWFLLLSDSAGELIVSRKLALNWLLLHGVVDARRPPGELIALDTIGTGQEASFDDLGTRVQLEYIEASSVAEMLAAP